MSILCCFCCDNCGTKRPTDAQRTLPTGWGAGVGWDGQSFNHLCYTCMVDRNRWLEAQ